VSKSKILLLLAILAILTSWLVLPPEYRELFTLKGMQAHLNSWENFRDHHYVLSAGLFAGIYILAAAFSLPFASLLSLLGGALFGFANGTFLVLTSATIGATASMLIARIVLQDQVRKKLGDKSRKLEEGFDREGAFYLFALRLVPVFPFWAINLFSGITSIKVRTYFWVSYVGMLPGTAAYVYAGLELSQLESLGGILSPGILGAFAALGLLPLLSKKILNVLRARKIYKGWRKPKKFDYNQIVIGAGAGGLVSSYIGAAMGAKTALIEKHKMGGDCLNSGCVPSKALIHAAEVVQQAREAQEFLSPVSSASNSVNAAKVLEHVSQSIRTIAPHDSVERYTKLGVNVYTGSAELISPWEVAVQSSEGKRIVLSARSIILASGAEPFVPPLPGLQDVPWYTSDTLWDLDHLPKRMAVMGGGPIGCELAQALARLGVQVSQFEMSASILSREDEDVQQHITQALKNAGVKIHTNTKVTGFRREGHRNLLDYETKETHHEPSASDSPIQIGEFEFDGVLIAVGRKARSGFGMKKLGIKMRDNGTIETNEKLQTNFPNIYAVGDATGPLQFTHFASHQAWYASVNSLISPFYSFKADYRVIPRSTYTSPEAARVGLSEAEAKAQGIDYEVTRYDMKESDRAVTEKATNGFVKVLTPPGKDKILGVSIVGKHAGELLAEWTLAIKHNLGLKKILGTVHAYPTLAESSKATAGLWANQHKPEKLVRLGRKFFQARL